MAACATPVRHRSAFPGTIWGGVIANQGNVQFSRGDAQSGFYFGAGGQYLTGYNVSPTPASTARAAPTGASRRFPNMAASASA